MRSLAIKPGGVGAPWYYWFRIPSGTNPQAALFQLLASPQLQMYAKDGLYLRKNLRIL
jgi:hypothetical protein